MSTRAKNKKKHAATQRHNAHHRSHKGPTPTHTAPARAGVRQWIGGARLRTLPLAVTPVIIGTATAHLVDPNLHVLRAVACLAVAVFLQIGVNFMNDYSDGIRGTDAHRLGPQRLTGSGLAKPRTVLSVGLVFFALAALVGLALIIRTEQWWLLLVGVACFVAAWFYTGGKRPYGYFALGEVAVFVFFGLVATVGTTWIEVQQLPQEVWFGAVAAGCFACAVLLANNLRDIPQDREAGKRTLSVVIGKRGSQALYTALVAIPFVIVAALAPFYFGMWLVLVAVLFIGPALLVVWMYENPKELVVALSLTSLGALCYSVFVFVVWGL